MTLAAALVFAFLTCWIFLPPFHAVLIPLAVGAPEVSPALSVAGIVLALLSGVRARGNRRARWACAIALAGTAVAVSPLVRLPPVTRSFDRAMRDALGPEALAAPAPEQTRFRRSPLSVRDALVGLKFGSATAQRDIRFATAGGVDLTLDVYQPATAGMHPAVVQVYGGAWQRGSPHDYGRFAAHLASLGYVVFAIDYRHAPQWKWPAQMADLRAALEWIRAHGADYRADVSRVAMIGRSAGAQLALMAAYDSPACRSRRS